MHHVKGYALWNLLCRSEARVMLKAAADTPGSHVVHSLYALALINAEGGHYQEVRRP